MKNKGFTLIELLAVIVILAIIALIAVPIIINIVNDARESSYKRSVELYGKSVENAIAKSQLNGEAIQAGELSSAFLETVQYEGTEVTCDTNMLYEDGKIYLAGCSVGTHEVDYTYGEEQTPAYQQVYQPDYYMAGVAGGEVGASEIVSGTAGTTSAPENPLTEPPAGKRVYIGYKISSGKVSDPYLCFKENGNEYCIKPNDYETSKDILSEAFGTACSEVYDEDEEGYIFTCAKDSKSVSASDWGHVTSSVPSCRILGTSFQCAYET